MVAGGYRDYRIVLSSTEILYHGQSKWMEISGLPFAVFGLRGATLRNTVYMFGENFYIISYPDILINLFSPGGASEFYESKEKDKILRFDAREKKWIQEGTMKHRRYNHGVSVINVRTYCPSSLK